MTSRKIASHVGQLVGIPLRDGRMGLGHVARVDGSNVALVLFAETLSPPRELPVIRTPVAVCVTTDSGIEDGDWPVLGSATTQYDFALPPGSRVSSQALAQTILDAIHGSFPWDGMKNPKYFEPFLLPGAELVRKRGKECFEDRGGGVFLPLAEPVGTRVAREQSKSRPASASNGPVECEITAALPTGGPDVVQAFIQEVTREVDALGETEAFEQALDGSEALWFVRIHSDRFGKLMEQLRRYPGVSIERL